MWGRLCTRTVIALLKWVRLDNESRQLLTSALLDKLGAIPVHARITVDDAGQVFVDGRPLTLEASRQMHDASKAMLNNFARRFVREQVTYMAIQKGVHQNISPEQGLFAKAALWFFQEEDELYRKFAQVEVVEDGQ